MQPPLNRCVILFALITLQDNAKNMLTNLPYYMVKTNLYYHHSLQSNNEMFQRTSSSKFSVLPTVPSGGISGTESTSVK